MTSEEIRRVHDSRHHRITNSLGVYDAYKWIRKNKWLDLPRPIKEHEFYSVIRKVNELLAEELLQGHEITLPCRMGKLEVRKKPVIIRFENKRLITNRPVNWKATINLWLEDKEAKENKTLIREESKELFKVHYNKSNVDYRNKTYYTFTPNRELRVGLKQKIKNNELNAYKLYEYME